MEDSTHIDSTKISLYIQQLEFTVSNLEATITRMKKECFDPKKFYGTAITVDACARMHSVCTVTVREYVHAGLIPTHPGQHLPENSHIHNRCLIARLQTAQAKI